jgi:fibro-slime domain-containing protein
MFVLPPGKRFGRIVLVVSLSAVAAAQEPVATFGTTVVIPSGLRGSVYHIPHNTTQLPNFQKMKPVGAIYTSSLDIPPQDFKQGFHGVTNRFEWFAIDYTGRFWIDDPGKYTFSLLSDDGGWLYIDDQLVIDNGGLHTPEEKTGNVDLSGGIHRIRVSYFQGPKWQVALVLKVAGPGEQLRVFSTEEFRPPPNPELWRYPEVKK